MKLKKIVSLALAGIMAVSMLTGCFGGGNAGNSTVISAVNAGQSADNQVKINFTSSSDLDAALKHALKDLGNGADSEAVADQIRILMKLSSDTTFANLEDYFVSAQMDTNKADSATALDSYKGTKNTALEVIKLDQVADQQAAAKAAANAVNTKVAQLKKTTYAAQSGTVNYGDSYVIVLQTQVGNPYCDFDYTGNVSMVSVKNSDGTTSYYVAYTVTQTTSVKILEKT